MKSIVDQVELIFEYTDGKVLHNYRFQIPLSEAQQSRISGYDGGLIKIHQITVLLSGFQMSTQRGEIGYLPDNWKNYINHINLKKSFKKNDRDAIELIISFGKWNRDRIAKETAGELRAGRITFESVREYSPSLLHHPAIQSVWSDLFSQDNIPKGKVGKRARVSREEIELYHWAHYYYAEDNESYRNACQTAIEKHPELVPKSWEKNPEDTLYARTHDKYDKTNFSQASYRARLKKERDITK